jgi:hypothetical protein
MKNLALKVFAFFIFFAATAAATPTYPQAKNITVKIPFQFTAQGKTLPAGIYVIGPAFQSDWNGLTIRSRDGRVSVSFKTTPVRGNENPYEIKMVFNKYGDQYFLSQFYKERERIGRELNKSQAERQLAERGMSPEIVVVAGS